MRSCIFVQNSIDNNTIKKGFESNDSKPFFMDVFLLLE